LYLQSTQIQLLNNLVVRCRRRARHTYKLWNLKAVAGRGKWESLGKCVLCLVIMAKSI